MQNQLVNSTTSKYNRLIASKMVLSYPLLGGDLRSGIQYSNHYTYETGNPFLVSEISRDGRCKKKTCEEKSVHLN